MNTPVLSAPPPLGSVGTAGAKRVLFISHEASRTGAPMFLLHLVRWLRRSTDLAFDVLVAKSGPLEAEFAKVATVYPPKAFVDDPHLIRSYRLIYSNTICNGVVVDELGAEGIPIVTHAHELESGYQWLGALPMALVLRQTTRFVACAKLVARRLRETFALDAAGIDVRYEMIDPAEMDARVAASNPAALRDTYDIPDDAFVVTGCGTLDLRKGTDFFVQAAVQLIKLVGGKRPVRFLWIGAHNALDLVRALTADVRKLGLQKEIQFIGELPSPHGLLALSDAYWLTSREDPFPLSMLEVAALGRPVFCFDGGGGGVEFCERGGGVAVPYSDVFALAEKTAGLIDDRARGDALGAQASALVRQQFVVEAIAPALWADIQGWLYGSTPLAPSPLARTPCSELYARWPLETAPGRAFIVAHQERKKAIASARALVAGGRKVEAVKLLLSTASAGVASKDAWILIETLIVIGTELTALEPKQSDYLLSEADRVVQSNAAFKSVAQAIRRNARQTAQLR